MAVGSGEGVEVGSEVGVAVGSVVGTVTDSSEVDCVVDSSASIVAFSVVCGVPVGMGSSVCSGCETAACWEMGVAVALGFLLLVDLSSLSALPIKPITRSTPMIMSHLRNEPCLPSDVFTGG